METASKSATDGGKVPAISVLGAKGAGKSVFFRYFFYKHCTKRLVVYVPNAGTNAERIYRKLVTGLIFGLQCCNHSDAERMLDEVTSQPIMGNVENFCTLWSNLSQKYTDLCLTAYIVIDQLQREGDLFVALSEEVIRCASYILISSSGILHHHNVSSVYKKLTYFYPVSPSELSTIAGDKALNNNLDQQMTMLGAISMVENRNVQEIYVIAARKHYENVKRKNQLNMLLATVQSRDLEETINGSIWEDVLDPNYFWVDEARFVKVVDQTYMEELRRLLTEDKVNYKKILTDLLSEQNIVNEVGNAALGVHVEALLDIMWQEYNTISWSQERKLGSGTNRNSRSRATKKIPALPGKKFKDIQPVCFDGMAPEQADLEDLDWNKPMYFKPRATNYAGFDMFLLGKEGRTYFLIAFQVTVKNAKDHAVKAFDHRYRTGWNNLLQPYLKNKECSPDLDWRFYMLTPESNPGLDLPSSGHEQIPIYQVGFRDLIPSGDLKCGIKVVNDFVDLLEGKPQMKKQKRS